MHEKVIFVIHSSQILKIIVHNYAVLKIQRIHWKIYNRIVYYQWVIHCNFLLQDN